MPTVLSMTKPRRTLYIFDYKSLCTTPYGCVVICSQRIVSHVSALLVHLLPKPAVRAKNNYHKAAREDVEILEITRLPQVERDLQPLVQVGIAAHRLQIDSAWSWAQADEA